MAAERTREVSVFVDESGSFESDERSSRYYLVCFVFHEQSVEISPWVSALEAFLEAAGLGAHHCVHVGPLVRREGEYSNMDRKVRQAVFRHMAAFVRKSPISYRCFLVDKHFEGGDSAVHDSLLRQMSGFLASRSDLTESANRLKVYYDNGQSQVRGLLAEVFAPYSVKTEFVANVRPDSYRLFQAADLLCTVELAAAKANDGGLSVSERRFFGERREFMRNVLKPLKGKRLSS